MDNGTKAIVTGDERPQCDFPVSMFDSTRCPDKARYDFRTTQGRWGNGCLTHWKEHRASPQLGTGRGQELFTKVEYDRQKS